MACKRRYSRIYLFTYTNFRNDKFKELRESTRETGAFCLASPKIIRVALGKDQESEHLEGLSELTDRLRGKTGLFFTNLQQDEVEKLLNNAESEDFARAGSKAHIDCSFEAGPLLLGGHPIAHTLEPSLRSNGLPTKLNKGVVELINDHTVCKVGDRLTTQQAMILRTFGYMSATFKLTLLAVFDKSNSHVINIADAGNEGSGSE